MASCLRRNQPGNRPDFQCVSFKRKDGIYDENNLTFCLGRQRRTLSLADFALRKEVYLPSEAHWNEIAYEAYKKGTTQESDIHSPLHHLLHCLITNTTNQRQEGDKCPTMNMFFLWALISSDAYVDLPFLLADFIMERVGKDRQRSPSYVFTIPNDTPRDRPGKRVRQLARGPEGDELPVISTEDEMSMDPYSVAQRRLTTWHGRGITPT
ncbi:unnamed protein product [Lactuca saligna]|uniref:Uncharacterized protein n=1 Tax=Lactuca saligna TaxID=75948 RepID=A0AA36E6W8_LACSI|nr:unnamed protein product [Lactuca saligna]